MADTATDWHVGVLSSNEYQESGKCLAPPKGGEGEEDGVKALDHPAHISEKRVGSRSILCLEITDPLVTKRGQGQHQRHEHSALLHAYSHHASPFSTHTLTRECLCCGQVSSR